MDTDKLREEMDADEWEAHVAYQQSRREEDRD
jgi:hypothetical protein